MGLFNFFNRKDNNSNEIQLQNSESENQQNLPEIPENVFVEKSVPLNEDPEEIKSKAHVENGISLLFNFLEKNYESKGYEDALINPDTTHLDQNINALKNDLERTIRKVKTFYEDFIREINFHIDSRKRSGMVDTVEELTVKKDIAESHIKQIFEIETQAKNNEGVGQGIIISYTRGFRNGLSAISHHAIMKKNF
jgi:hypothetical protein